MPERHRHLRFPASQSPSRSHTGPSPRSSSDRTLDQPTSLLDQPEPALTEEVLDRIDAIVPPGTDLYPVTASSDPPWLHDAALRRSTRSRAPLPIR